MHSSIGGTHVRDIESITMSTYPNGDSNFSSTSCEGPFPLARLKCGWLTHVYITQILYITSHII